MFCGSPCNTSATVLTVFLNLSENYCSHFHYIATGVVTCTISDILIHTHTHTHTTTNNHPTHTHTHTHTHTRAHIHTTLHERERGNVSQSVPHPPIPSHIKRNDRNMQAV